MDEADKGDKWPLDHKAFCELNGIPEHVPPTFVKVLRSKH
jgi:hypothetical protein